MNNDLRQNNTVTISGEIVSDYTYTHEVYGEKFYTFNLASKRLSTNYDIIPVTISERLNVFDKFPKGSRVSINGQLRSYNDFSQKKNHLILTVFTKEIRLEEISSFTPNLINLNGFICKTPVYRTTPFGREIADILLAVNRAYGKSDYIPCIAWGRNARFASSLEVGDNIKLTGRMQSRNYQKKTDEGLIIEKTAYEVSISKIELIEKNKKSLNNSCIKASNIHISSL